ncbi:MAG: hypothetical protein ACTSRI_11170 [Promethearchaeota archaeon]
MGKKNFLNSLTACEQADGMVYESMEWYTNQYLQRNHVDCLKFLFVILYYLLFFKVSFLILNIKRALSKACLGNFLILKRER